MNKNERGDYMNKFVNLNITNEVSKLIKTHEEIKQGMVEKFTGHLEIVRSINKQHSDICKLARKQF